MILNMTECFAETLEMDDLPFTKITNGVTNVRIFHHPQNIVIGCAGLLFCCGSAKTEYY